MNPIKTISLIGAGNVAHHLGKAIRKNNFSIKEVYSQKLKNATSLAEQLSALPCNKISELDPSSDLYIICVKDEAIKEVLKQFTFYDKLIAHTSGSVSISAFEENNMENYGVFYPLQTFSKKKEVNLFQVPFCIEASSSENEKRLSLLAKSLSQNIYQIDSKQRKILHLAAIFANNFTNHMYHIAEEITTTNGVDFDILKPLILETAAKIENNTAIKMQTGPAIRDDKKTISEHLKMLENSTNYREVYDMLTKSIKNSL